MATPKRRDNPPLDAIQLTPEPNGGRREGMNSSLHLAIFMRVVAMLWMARGLMFWRSILISGPTPFENLPTPVAAAIVFFAVADLLAAVGLWLAAPWGGVLWLFAAGAGIAVSLILPEFGFGGRIAIVIDFALIVGYFVLTWHAARERDD